MTCPVRGAGPTAAVIPGEIHNGITLAIDQDQLLPALVEFPGEATRHRQMSPVTYFKCCTIPDHEQVHPRRKVRDRAGVEIETDTLREPHAVKDQGMTTRIL